MSSGDSVVDVVVNYAKNNCFTTIIISLVILKVLCGLCKRPKSVKDEIVFISGAASGIGRQVAIQMAAMGSKVVVADIDFEKAKQVAQEISSKKQASLPVHCDVTSVESIRKALEVVRNHFGSPTILINNAGIVSGKPITELSYKEIERTMTVNSVSHFYTIKEMIPDMIKANKGHIVSIASVAGHAGVARMTDYCASKFAAVGLNESLRLELKHIGSNIQTTCICPYYINTGMFTGVSSLIPLLKEEWVGSRIIKAIRYNELEVYMPSIFSSGMFLKAILPASWCDSIFTALGFNRSMDTFKGRH